MRVILFISFLCFFSFGFSQEIEREVIGSSGNSSTNGSVTLDATVGEVAVQTLSNGTIFITQGFQQPQDIVIPELDLKFYNGITPNGDGTNDIWEIDGISQYPNNDVVIFGRSGNEVWSGTGYDNVNVVFSGDDKAGNALSGTYYYIMTFASGDVYKGWLEVTR